MLVYQNVDDGQSFKIGGRRQTLTIHTRARGLVRVFGLLFLLFFSTPELLFFFLVGTSKVCTCITAVLRCTMSAS